MEKAGRMNSNIETVGSEESKSLPKKAYFGSFSSWCHLGQDSVQE